MNTVLYPLSIVRYSMLEKRTFSCFIVQTLIIAVCVFNLCCIIVLGGNHKNINMMIPIKFPYNTIKPFTLTSLH